MSSLRITECIKEQERVHMLEICSIAPNRQQPRKSFEDGGILALADSISRYGILQPLSVRRNTGEGQPYELVAGERRLRAAQLLRMRRVPCIIVNADDETSAVMSIIENIQRQDLNIFEEAEAIQTLKNVYQLTQERIAAILSVSQSYVANKLRILKLSELQRRLILENSMTERHCRALLRISDEGERNRALTYIIKHRLNVSGTEAYVDKLLADRIPVRVRTSDRKLKDLRVFFNSIDRAVNTARDLGVNVSRETLEDENTTKVIISVINVSRETM